MPLDAQSQTERQDRDYHKYRSQSELICRSAVIVHGHTLPPSNVKYSFRIRPQGSCRVRARFPGACLERRSSGGRDVRKWEFGDTMSAIEIHPSLTGRLLLPTIGWLAHLNPRVARWRVLKLRTFRNPTR